MAKTKRSSGNYMSIDESKMLKDIPLQNSDLPELYDTTYASIKDIQETNSSKDNCTYIDQSKMLKDTASTLKACVQYRQNTDAPEPYEHTLFLALLEGDTDQIKFLCTRDGDVDIPDSNGRTALLAAAEKGKTKGVEILLHHNANIDWQDNKDQTALHWASWGGHTDTVDFLCRKGAAVDIPSIDGLTALIEAAQHGHTESVDVLLDYKADVNWQSNDKETALFKASYGGHVDTVELLCRRGAGVDIANNEGATALYVASKIGHKDIVELLCTIDADADVPNVRGNTALIAAAQNGHTKCVEILLDYNANINFQAKDGWTALSIASHKGHLETVEVLCEGQANIDSPNNTSALIEAARKGHTNCVDVLLNYNASINWKNAALLSAIHNGHVSTTELLLKRGVDPTIADDIDQSGLSEMKNNATFAALIDLPKIDANKYIKGIRGSWMKINAPALIFTFSSRVEMMSAYYKLILCCEIIGWKCTGKFLSFATFIVNKGNDTQVIAYPRESRESGRITMEIYRSKTASYNRVLRVPPIYRKLEAAELLHVNKKSVTTPHVCPCLDDKHNFMSGCLIKCHDLEMNGGTFALAMCPQHQKIISGDKIAMWFEPDEPGQRSV